MATRFCRGHTLLTVAVTFTLALAACGGSDSEDGGGTGSDEADQAASGNPLDSIGYINAPGDEGEPVEGGTLVFAPYAPARSLDPAIASDSGVANAELAAIYDALMRYDYEKKEYVPWQAETLEPNEDFTVWTLTLREGVTFSDGTPLDSAAVALQMERTQQNRPGLYTHGITTATPDNLTVVYTLPSPWAGFPYALSANPGRIPSPTAVEAKGEDFANDPVGSGPFVFESWAHGEELVVTANEDYWGDGPYLDGIRFVTLVGDQARLDSIASGDIDAGFLRVPAAVNQALEDGLGGFNNVFPAGEVLIINNGVNSDDTAGADVRVRRAIAMALDPEVLNQDVNDGEGIWTKEVLGGVDGLDTTVEATEYDPEGAADLLDEAKADGYDGAVTLTCDSAPEREREGLAIQAQLNAVGFEVELDRVPGVVDTIRKYQTEGSYELACYGFSMQESTPYVGVAQVLAPDNRLGYDDPDIAGIIDDLRDAPDAAAAGEAVDALQTEFNETQPFLPLAAVRELIAWGPAVHGVEATTYNMPVFDGAWIAE